MLGIFSKQRFIDCSLTIIFDNIANSLKRSGKNSKILMTADTVQGLYPGQTVSEIIKIY